MDQTRRILLQGIAAGAVAGLDMVANPPVLAAVPGKPTPTHLPVSLEHALVWDNHSGFDPRPDFDLEYLHQWRDAGVDFLSINVGYDAIDWRVAIATLASYMTWLEKRRDRFVLVRQAQDVPAAKAEGKMAITFDLEGMNALNGDPSMVSLYYRLGVRQMLTAYNRNNAAGGGCHDDDHGLTDYGRRVIQEMNRVGMLVDCSHTGALTTMQIMATAAAPVVFSHSNPKALRAHGRNITDEQIRACARTGGVIGINGMGLYLPQRDSTARAMIDCIIYVRDLVGIDHVGLGLDYATTSPGGELPPRKDFWWPPADYNATWPMKSASPRVIPEIAAGLLERGLAPTDVAKVLGGNFLRVAQAVWK
jgi:membrane dipeptidase